MFARRARRYAWRCARFRFRLTDARRADDAAAKVFTAIRDLPGRYDDDLILSLASARQNALLDAFESIDTRGWWCADFLQFTTHGRFQMRELSELQHLDPALLRQRGGQLSRDVSRVVRIAQDLQAERMVLMLGGRQEDVAAAFAAAGVTRFDTVTEQPAAR